MYGALPACPECSSQALSFKEGEYVCGGMASEWGRCLYKSAEVKHLEWDLSESDHDYLTSFKFKFQKKPTEAYAFFAAESRTVAEQHKVRGRHMHAYILFFLPHAPPPSSAISSGPFNSAAHHLSLSNRCFRYACVLTNTPGADGRGRGGGQGQTATAA